MNQPITSQTDPELEKPENKKYSKYLNSFWSLTRDEQAGVRTKHVGLNRYLTILEDDIRMNCELLRKALEVGGPSAIHGSLGGALQVEDLSAVLKLVTFDYKYLELA